MSTLSWPAWGTTACLRVTDDAALRPAARLADRTLARTEKAADLRLAHAEVHRLDGSAGTLIRVSHRLAALLRANLDAAELTGGLLDPTVGAAVLAAEAGTADGTGDHLRGRRRDLELIPTCGRPTAPGPRPAPGWRSIRLDGRQVAVPAFTILDLSAIAKARTAQHCADLIHNTLGVGALVGLGGDIATAGPAPVRGWPVPGRPGQLLPAGSGAATLTRSVIDPASGLPAPAVWSSVTVTRAAAGGGCVAAKALAVAVAVLGSEAPRWLAARQAGATLVPYVAAAARLGTGAA